MFDSPKDPIKNSGGLAVFLLLLLVAGTGGDTFLKVLFSEIKRFDDSSTFLQ